MTGNLVGVFKELGFRYDPSNLYQQTIETILHAADMIELPRYLCLMLAQPKNEVIVHFPVRLDDGSYRLCKGYRVQHNNVLGPYKGGIRYHPDICLDEIKALSVLMSMKTALARLPLGGAKGGVQVDPHSMSHDELMRLTRRFTSALGPNIGPAYDIPAPDVGTNAQVMAWITDTYINITPPSDRFGARAVVTGKPLEFGGSHGREKATGQGLVFALDIILPEMGLEVDKLTFSLLGFGNVGSWAGRLLCDRGAKLTAVMDHTGAIRNDQGIDAYKLARHVSEHRGVCNFPEADAVDEETFYRSKVDLFIPAALEQMIQEQQAHWLDCKVMAEAANAPTTPEGERVLVDRGVTILPAILCNSGGVTVSYLEWKQNRSAETWNAEYVDTELKRYIQFAAQRTRLAKQKFEVDWRTAAYCAALEYIGKVYSLRGIFP